MPPAAMAIAIADVLRPMCSNSSPLLSDDCDGGPCDALSAYGFRQFLSVSEQRHIPFPKVCPCLLLAMARSDVRCSCWCARPNQSTVGQGIRESPCLSVFRGRSSVFKHVHYLPQTSCQSWTTH